MIFYTDDRISILTNELVEVSKNVEQVSQKLKKVQERL